ncbi:hypothetical protein ACIREM_27955 [Streptomyces shenzhenensis]|uniref:hypothetical protein n=1 Tax=Streptomyces shenzhenensis TaxID=943815 RepID=UPI0038176864
MYGHVDERLVAVGEALLDDADTLPDPLVAGVQTGAEFGVGHDTVRLPAAHAQDP